jgi:hypothetical protein
VLNTGVLVLEQLRQKLPRAIWGSEVSLVNGSLSGKLGLPNRRDVVGSWSMGRRAYELISMSLPFCRSYVIVLISRIIG